MRLIQEGAGPAAANTAVPPETSVVTRPSSRVVALDLTRLAAMLLMVQGHTLSALVTPEQLDIMVFPWNVWHFIRGLTAPIFLLVSGAVHVFANKRDENGHISGSLFWRRMRWGITLIGIAYLWTFPAGTIADFWLLPDSSWTRFWQVNILHLTGVALCLLMLLVYSSNSSRSFAWMSFATGMVITLATPFVQAVDWHSFLHRGIANYLDFRGGSLFPFFPFAAYLFFGVAIGRYLQIHPAEDRLNLLKTRVAFLGLLFFAIAWLAQDVSLPLLPEHNFWHASPLVVLMRSGLAMIFMGVMALLYSCTKSLKEHYTLLGGKSLHIYIAHLLLLYGTPWHSSVARTNYQQYSLPEGIAFALGIILLCGGYAYLLDYIQRRHGKLWRRVLIGALIALLTLFLLNSYINS